MKQFYQCDVAESDTDIWTGPVLYTDSPEEAEFLTMLELQADWGDGYMPDAFIVLFGEERRDGCDPDPEFPGVEAWREAGYWTDIPATTSMLIVDPLTALAKLNKIDFDIPGDVIEAVMAGEARLHVVVDMKGDA